MPIKSESIDYWASPESGITRNSIAANHTMHPYFAISYTPELRMEIESVLNGGFPALTYDRKMAFKSRRSWIKRLRYCPLCVAEDIFEYGETYWHRKHQLPGCYYCTKHLIRLFDSQITTKAASTGFYPASSETRVDVADAAVDVFREHKDVCLKIGRESEWLLENGLSVDWHENGRDKYLRLFRDSGIASVYGTRCDSEALCDAVSDYWGSEFIDALFSKTPVYHEWLSRIHANMMYRFLPLQHILLMCVAKGSVEEFVSCNVSENPFGTAPFACENPICVHFHSEGVICTEIKKFNSRAVGYFLCKGCGMRYKISKAKSLKGVTVVLDYGHIWINELIRCSHDKNISNAKTAEILGCTLNIVMTQKQKMGLLRAPRYDIELGPEAFYKSQVIALVEEYGEVTFSVMQKNVPQAYDYLSKHDKEWLSEHMTLHWETANRRAYIDSTKEKICQAVAEIRAKPPDRQISYGYLAEIAGLTRDNLRSNRWFRALAEGIVETRVDWQRRRITTAYHKMPIEDRPYTVDEVFVTISCEAKTLAKYRNSYEEVIAELNAI